MKRISVNLIGKHANRIPLAYLPYQGIANDFFNYVNDPLRADILLFGFSRDIEDNLSTVEYAMQNNSRVKLAVLSEEPLWDTIWSDKSYCKEGCSRNGKLFFSELPIIL